MTARHPATPSVRVTAHRRYLLEGASHIDEKCFVHCPVENAFVDAVECNRCGHCAARIESPGQATRIECVPPADSRTPAVAHGAASTECHAIATRAFDTCAQPVLCVRPDLPIAHAASHARRTNARFLVAIDAALHPLGVIGLDDLQRIQQAAPAIRLAVGDVMRPLQLALPAEVSVSVATAALAQSSTDEAVLVGNDGEVLALLRSVDLLRWHARADGYVIGEVGEVGAR